MTGKSACARFEALQDQLLADEAPLTQEDEAFLAEHVDECSACALETATLKALTDVQQADVKLSDAVIANRVEALLDRHEGKPAPASNRNVGWKLGFGFAAAAAAVAALIIYLPGSSKQGPGTVTTSNKSVAARVTLVSGDVRLDGTPAAVLKAVAPGQRLAVGKGQAVLRYEDGTTVVAEADSQISWSRDRHVTRVRLERGEAIFEVVPRMPGHRFVVSAPWGEVQVVGTVFAVVSTRNVQEVIVSRGTVRVERADKAPVTVREGLALSARGGMMRRLVSKAKKKMLRRTNAAQKLAVKKAAVIEVSSPRPGALVELDGKRLGYTPLIFSVEPGTRTVSVGRTGFLTQTKQVELAAGDRVIVSLNPDAHAALDKPQPKPDIEPPPTVEPKPTYPTGPVTQRPLKPDTPTPTVMTPPEDTTPMAMPQPVEPPTPMQPVVATPTVGQLLSKAAALRRKGSYAAALKVYRQLRQQYPSSTAAATCLVLVGQLQLRNLGQASAALSSFGAYLRGHPRGGLAPEASWGRVQAFRRLGKKTAELKACQALIKRHPNSIYARRARARLKRLASKNR